MTFLSFCPETIAFPLARVQPKLKPRTRQSLLPNLSRSKVCRASSIRLKPISRRRKIPNNSTEEVRLRLFDKSLRTPIRHGREPDDPPESSPRLSQMDLSLGD
jgi:hypothetical protein